MTNKSLAVGGKKKKKNKSNQMSQLVEICDNLGPESISKR